MNTVWGDMDIWTVQLPKLKTRAFTTWKSHMEHVINWDLVVCVTDASPICGRWRDAVSNAQSADRGSVGLRPIDLYSVELIRLVSAILGVCPRSPSTITSYPGMRK